METFIEYILKSSIYLSLLIALYRFLFKNEMYFKLNRIFLLVSILISCLLFPVLMKIISFSGGNTINTILLPEITFYQDIPKQINIAGYNIISLIIDFYFFITGILLIRLLFQILQILRLYIISSNYKTNSTIIYTDDHPPFSFFNLIFINKNNCIDDIDKIILHESVHVNQFHTLDILLVEIVCIFHWFNPFIWLYKASFREIHEYLADEGVINKGCDKKGYQSLMLSVATGIKDFKPSNKFNSLIKKRMIMMSKQKSTNSSLIKYALVIPVIGILWLIPSIQIEKSYAVNLKPESSKIVPVLASVPQSKEEVFMVVENQPEYIGGQKAMTDFLLKNVNYPENDKKNGIEGTVYVSFIVEKDGTVSEVKAIRGVNVSLDNEAIRVVKLMSKKWKPGTQKGKAVRVQFNLPIKFKLTNEKK
jgi:TonB family protein